MRTHPASHHPDLIVGTDHSDDAGVYVVAPGRALVQTVDFFTPVVDEPYDWGRIAAANALSDVYAMGATPLTALQLVAWPRDGLPFELAAEVVTGGSDVMAAAGVTVLGGHSIDDAEPKYGFAVTGLVDPAHVVTNSGAVPGDRLVLTKPLGLGVITTAIKRGAASTAVRDEAVDWMTRLNADAAAAMVELGAVAATDVTGFGLLGHLAEMTAGAGVGARIDAGAVPVIEAAWGLLDDGMYPGGSERNLESVAETVRGGTRRQRMMLADAQTSGGLLIAIAVGAADELCARLGAWQVGEIVEGSGILLD